MISEKKLVKMAEEVMSIVKLDYAPVDFIPNGFKVLLTKELNENEINKVENEMMKEGFLSMYIDDEPEEGFTSNLTVIKFG